MDRNIVILGNGHEWCEKSLADFKNIENTKIINSIFPCEKDSIPRLLKLHFSDKLNKIITLPFKKLWFPYFAKNISKDIKKPLLIIIYDRNKLANNIQFLEYIKKKYYDVKLIYIFTNIAKISGASRYGFLDKLDRFYDLVYAFDPADSKQYGFKYHPLLYSANKVNDIAKNENVFYVGAAKDRYNMLIEVYERLEQLNIESQFYIFGVDEAEQLYNDKIVYNKYISYNDCLQHIQSSRCLLDIIQGDSEGFTIKVCEAVIYDKLLITTNQNIKSAPFYNSEYMLVISEPEDIVKEFFDNKKVVRYSKEAKEYFSINRFLDVVEADLFEQEIGESKRL